MERLRNEFAHREDELRQQLAVGKVTLQRANERAQSLETQLAALRAEARPNNGDELLRLQRMVRNERKRSDALAEEVKTLQVSGVGAHASGARPLLTHNQAELDDAQEHPERLARELRQTADHALKAVDREASLRVEQTNEEAMRTLKGWRQRFEAALHDATNKFVRGFSCGLYALTLR